MTADELIDLLVKLERVKEGAEKALLGRMKEAEHKQQDSAIPMCSAGFPSHGEPAFVCVQLGT